MAPDIRERGIDLLATIWHFMDLTPQGAATGTPTSTMAPKYTPPPRSSSPKQSAYRGRATCGR